MQAWECAEKAKAELQKISDDIPEHKPDEDVQPWGCTGRVQGESSRGSGSQPGGAKDKFISCDKKGSEGRAV